MEAFIQNVSAKYKENNEFIVHFCIMYFVSKIQNVVDSDKSQKVLDFKKVLKKNTHLEAKTFQQAPFLMR